MENMIDVSDLRGTTRFSDYCKAVTSRVVAVEASHRGTGEFCANIVERRLGPLQLFQISSDPVAICRSQRCISRDSDNQYIIAFNESSDCSVQHGTFGMDVPMGTFYLLDKARPYSAEFDMPSSRLLVCVPRILLEQRVADPGQFLNCVAPASAGVARIASEFIFSFLRGSGSLSNFQQSQVAEVCLDLLVLALNAGVSGGDPGDDGGRLNAVSGRMLVSRIKAYIRANLGDSQLTPGTIAEAQGISKRYLHHVFAESGKSVGAWLREERLLQARAALGDPRTAHKSVTEIAFDYGFGDSAHFSRSFKAQFGVSPSKLRPCRKH